MSSQRFVPAPPMKNWFWFWLILFACFGLVTSLSCSVCKSEKACEEEETKADCDAAPAAGMKYVCGTTEVGNKIQSKGCVAVPDTQGDGCNGPICLCPGDMCNEDPTKVKDNGASKDNKGKGNGSGGAELTKSKPWNSLFWIGLPLGFARFYTAVLH